MTDKPLPLMTMTIETTARVQKRMSTSATKSGEDEMVICQIGVKGLRVTRDQMDELAGLPIGATGSLFNELGLPTQRMSFLLPKRELLLSGKIEHRRESGHATATLQLKLAACADLRFNLDVPDDAGPTALMSFTAHWKAAGDEVDDVKDLLNKLCYMKLTFREPPLQTGLELTQGAPTAQADQAAGDRTKLDRKRRASGEKESDNEDRPTSPPDKPPEPAAAEPAPPGKKGSAGGLAKLEREAAEHAKRHPRKDPPKPLTSRRH